MYISIVVPVFEEEESIIPLYKSITESVKEITDDYEIILIDDGSRDNTCGVASEKAKKDAHLKIIKLKTNYGQTTALYAGFQEAEGEIIVTMDGDLQNDPSDIGNFVNKIKEGNDVVLGWRYDRKDKFLSRKLPSKIANWLVRKVTGVPVKDNGCAIRAYSSDLIKRIPMYSEMHRLLPVIIALTGAKFAQIKVKHHPRLFGKSKYGLSRIYKVLLDLIALKSVFASFYIPLFGFGIFAIIAGAICLCFFVLGIINILINPEGSIVVIIGAATIMGALSSSLFSLGIICHLIYKTGNLKIENLYEIE